MGDNTIVKSSFSTNNAPMEKVGIRSRYYTLPNLKYTNSKVASLISMAAIVLYAMTALAQSASERGSSDSNSVAHACGPASVIPLAASEPPAKIHIDPPLAQPLASRGVAIIQYCAENLHIVPVFGPNAVAVSPRVGHIHVAVDDASWVWADASGNPIILQGLLPGPHKVRIDLVDANHHPLDKGMIKFVVPKINASEKHH